MKQLWIIVFLWMGWALVAQAQNPVQWTFSTKKLKKGQYKLLFEAQIQSGWAIYSQYLEEGGPVPTSFNFKTVGSAELVGKVEESSEHKIEGMDEIFEMKVIKYKEKVTFSQVVKVTSPTTISGELSFMACDSESCLPPKEVPFSFSLKK